MIRRLGILLLALALAAGACKKADSEPTTTRAAGPTTTTAAPSTTTPGTTSPPTTGIAVPAFPDDDTVIGTDEDVLIGTLDNGLTYYIRRNTAPGGRAQLRLAVKAGSAHEDEDQHGVAHYLEHMMFNGTEEFPANELIRVLERFGSDFGPDVNAYTSYEETVYELELPTDSQEILETGFDVLEQWATAATLDPTEVDLERGVLLEEWRVRDQRFQGRYRLGVADVLFEGTPYAGQDPLADADLLDATTPETLRRFYEDWYRPDLMAVIAVGDFDVDEVEQLIIERFGPIPAPEDPRRPPELFTLPFDDPAYFVLADPEYAEAWSELNYPLPAESPGTIGAQRTSLAMEMAWGMLSTRLMEDVTRGEADFYNPSRAANPFVRTQVTTGIIAFGEPSQLSGTTEALLEEVERALQHGFGEGELDRQRDTFKSGFQLQYDERETKQDHQWAADYVEHFLGGMPIPTADEWHELNLRLLDEMTVEQVSETFQAIVPTTEPFVIIVSPASAGDEIPTEDELAGIVEAVEGAPVDPRPDDSDSIDTLMEAPDPADVAVRGFVTPTEIPQLTLENGITVVLLPTEIRRDVVVFGAHSLGGWARYDEAEVAEAKLASQMVADSGVGPHDAVTLDRFLANRVMSVTPYIDETGEGLFGQAQSEDLEAMLQLIHLYMTAPRLDDSARDQVLDALRPQVTALDTDPDNAVTDALAVARYSGDDRFRPYPSLQEIETFDTDRALEIFEERFADASDFVFVFSGDFDLQQLETLVRRYLGTLPSANSNETFADVRPPTPRGTIVETVEAGSGERGRVLFQFSSEFALDALEREKIAVLERVVRHRLTERIREQLGATYSPGTRLQVVERPDQGVEAFLDIGGDPEDLEEVSTEVLADLADLRQFGPTEDELAIAQEQLVRDYELFSNELLVQVLLFYASDPGEDFTDFFSQIDNVLAVTADDVRSIANTVFPAGTYIEIRLVPAGGG